MCSKEQFQELKNEAVMHMSKAVDCITRAYLSPYIQEKLNNGNKLEQKEIIKKVDVASRMIYLDVLKQYFNLEDKNGKSNVNSKAETDEKASREGN